MPAKKRRNIILFVSHTSNLGGAEIVLLRFLSQVTLFESFVLLPKGRLYEELERNSVKVKKSKCLAKLNKEQNRFWIIQFFVQFFAGIKEIAKQISDLRPDIVQSNNVYTTVYCIIPCLLLRTPLIWHMHDFVSGKRGLRSLVLVLSRFSRKIITVSKAVKEDLIAAGIPASQIISVYNSISLEFLKEDNGSIRLKIQTFKQSFDLILGMAGTIEERKGYIECIQALSLVNKKKRIGLAIIGEANEPSQKMYESKLKEEIKKHGLEGHVLFLGRIKEIKPFFEEIDVFIHYPKQPDPLPTVILEAIALNCPVIVSDNGGNPEIVQNGRWGKLVKANDPAELANILNKKLSFMSSEDRKEFLDFFSHQNKENSHIKLYDQLIGSV